MNKDILVDQIFRDIRSGKEGRDQVIIRLYKDLKLRKGIQSAIIKMGGTQDDVNEVLTTTLMQFVKTVIQKKDLHIKYQLNTYIISIARYIWLAKRKKDAKYSYNEEYLEEEEWADSPETLILKKDKISLLHELMQKLGKNCKEVLMYWANGYKMKEIASLLDYKSENMAKKKKYQCFKSLLIYIEDNPRIKSALR